MLQKLSAAVLGAMLILGFGASATAYSPTSPDASVSSSTVAAGGSVTFTARGFAPNRAVNIAVTRTAIGAGGSGNIVTVVRTAAVSSQSVTADSAGVVSVVVPLKQSGVYTITASGVDPSGAARSVSQTVNVPAGTAAVGASDSRAGSATGAALARTGVDGVATLAWIAFGVVFLGGVLVAVASGRGRVRRTA